MTTTADVLVVGAGLAGACIGAHLAPRYRVVVVEQEKVAGFHTTGRSVATFSPDDGVPGATLPLILASQEFLARPPGEASLLSPRGLLKVVPDLERAEERARRQGRSVMRPGHPVTDERARELFPVLRERRVAAAVYVDNVHDLDVGRLHEMYLKLVRRHGGSVLLQRQVHELRRTGSSWTVRAGDEEISCGIVANAAGAWADDIARLAGARPVGLEPLLRTAFTVSGPPGCERWPLVLNASTGTYVKPDGPQLLCSPGDETLVEPHDAKPDDLAIAQAIEAINDVTTLAVRSVRTSWAGLRTFAPDRAPVIGFDPLRDGFFWFAGQGGSGIEMAPASGRLAASLIDGDAVPDDIVRAGLELSRVLPQRFHRDEDV
jgi:D-arginine dehydrogenase